MKKLPMTERRAEMTRHILAAKRIAAEGDEHVLEYMLDMALMEIVGNEDAEGMIERMTDEAIK